LQHPNEYLRGVTLRFLCRIKEDEILVNLIPSILTNLEHRHSYVRRSAVLAVNAIYKLPMGETLLQDAPETLEQVLRSEQDLSTKRNAFVMLSSFAQDKAAKYLFEHIESISSWGDILQMAVLEMITKVGMHAACMHIAAMLGPCVACMECAGSAACSGRVRERAGGLGRKWGGGRGRKRALGPLHLTPLPLPQVCRTNAAEKGRYIKVILALLQSSSASVVYECAVALVALSQAPSAIRAAANCYCQLLASQSDNNVRLILLDRLQELKEKHRDVMQDVLMDILRALASPDMDIRQKTLDIAMDLVTSRNIDEASGAAGEEGGGRIHQGGQGRGGQEWVLGRRLEVGGFPGPPRRSRRAESGVC
jgi:vesicle coat complex subunit